MWRFSFLPNTQGEKSLFLTLSGDKVGSYPVLPFDAIGTKQFDCEKSGELGVQRTM